MNWHNILILSGNSFSFQVSRRLFNTEWLDQTMMKFKAETIAR